MTADVTIYRFILDKSDDEVSYLAALLSADEVERAGRFHFDIHRKRYIVGRAMLRTTLSRILGTAPRKLQFAYSQYGKPTLEGDLRFNLSHSDSYAVLAVAAGCDVGVDVERVRRDDDLIPLARRFFSPAEVEQLTALPADEQTMAFFRCWTRKEAYIKADGAGLSIPLDAFSVALGRGDVPRLSGQGTEGWAVDSIETEPGYVGAVVAHAAELRLRYRVPALQSTSRPALQPPLWPIAAASVS